MNKTIIIGNLTANPVVNTRKIGEADVKVANFSVAVNEGYGESRKTSYFRVNVWRGLAETCEKFLVKGRKVMVTGPVALRQYQGTDGKIYTNLEIRAEEIEFLDRGQGNGQPEGIPADMVGNPETIENVPVEVTPDVLPF